MLIFRKRQIRGQARGNVVFVTAYFLFIYPFPSIFRTLQTISLNQVLTPQPHSFIYRKHVTSNDYMQEMAVLIAYMD